MSVSAIHNGMALQPGQRTRVGLLAVAASLFAPAARIRSRLREAQANLEEATARLSEELTPQQGGPARTGDTQPVSADS